MRHANVVLFVIILATMYFKWALSITFVPERTEVTVVNEKYIYNASARVTRYGRKSAYYYNIAAGLKHTWGNNVTIHMMFFEAQSTQYKRSLMERHMKMCDLFQRDQYFGKMFSAVLDSFGIACPLSPGMYSFSNITLPSDKLPNILPFQKGRLDITFSQLPTQDIIGKLFTIFSIKK